MSVLKGLSPEVRIPATAIMQDGDDVSFFAVFKRPDAAKRERINLVVMQALETSARLNQQVQAGELDAVAYMNAIRTNNTMLHDLVSENISRCEGLRTQEGEELAWSNEVYDQMMRSNEYGLALLSALRTLGTGKKLAEIDAKNSKASATGSTVAVLPMPSRA